MANLSEFNSEKRQLYNRYFSESFKKGIVRKLERNLISPREIQREYEVSRTSIYRWVYQFSSMKKKGIRQVVEPLSDSRKIIELRDRIRELEQLVGQKQIQLEFKDKMIEIAEEMYGVDIKKKLGSKPSAGSGSTGKNTAGK
jgi:transposase